MDRIPENIHERYIGSMIETAIKENIDFKILRLLLDRIPKDVDEQYIDNIWWWTKRYPLSRKAMEYYQESMEKLKKQRGMQ